MDRSEMQSQMHVILKSLYNEYEQKRQANRHALIEAIRWTERQNALLQVAELLDIDLKGDVYGSF